MGGGKTVSEHQQHIALRITPHARTLRKARENVRLMVADQVSPAKIRRYFSRWLHWWVNASNTWKTHQLLQSFMNGCWHESVSTYARALYHHHTTLLHTLVTTAGDLQAA